nr:PREDICTED: neuronal acetylcholine receptor subunit alpha-6-like isoform X1 [Megachile rotundata]
MRNILLALFVILLQDHQASGFVEDLLLSMSCKEIIDNSPLQQLKENLFCYYDEQVRPVENHRNVTVVDFGITMQHFQVDEFSHTVDFHVWARMMWKDPSLAWTPSQYSGIEWLQVMSYDIWVPDITLHSVSNIDIDMEMPRVICYLHHIGSVICVPSVVYTTYCESEHTWWPYDLMKCSLHIASWSHSSDEIKLRSLQLSKEGLLTQDTYDLNLEWQLVNMSETSHMYQSKFDVDFSSNMITYDIILQRYASMYTASFMTAILVLTAMTLMTLWLDPKSTERMVVANCNFVLHLLCLQDLQWKLPHNGTHPPKLLLFYENSLVLATFSLILTSLLRHMQELNTDAPVWLSSTTATILKSRVGQIFLVSILDPKVSATMEMNADDNTNLVSYDKKESTWKYTSILIGWLAFFAVLFTYVIMIAVFLPTNSRGRSVWDH